MDGLLMGYVARELDQLLAGGRVDKISQPDRDLVILHIRNGGANYRLLICATPGYARLHLTGKTYENPQEAPMFCMLMRKHLQGGRLLCVEQLFGDRLARLTFSAMDELGDPRENLLYVEAMGKHCNVSLVQDGKILDAMRHVTLDMSRVRQMLPGLPYVMPPAQDKLAPNEADAQAILTRLRGYDGLLAKFLFHNVAGLSQMSGEELALRVSGGRDSVTASLNQEDISLKLADLLHALPGMGQPTLLHDLEGTPREALPFPYQSLDSSLQQPEASFSQAIESLYFERDLSQRLSQRAAGLSRAIKNARERTEKKLAMLEEDILSEAQAEELRVMGELLTAGLHLVPRGSESVTLPDYYTGGELVIPLEPALSPAQNAQRYFTRYRKAHTARKLAGEQKEKALQDLQQLEEAQYFAGRAESAQELNQVRAPLAQAGLLRRNPVPQKTKREKEAPPKRFISRDGIPILVGRSSLENERLLKQARPDDLWLHAKDVPGSHVLITLHGGTAPDTTVLDAARLAVFFSKARGQRARVDYTLVKHVKKTPGSAPGQVHYSGEKSVVTEANEEDIKALAPDDGKANKPNKSSGKA